MCLSQKAPSKVQYKINVFKCFTSWLQLGVISLDAIEQVGKQERFVELKRFFCIAKTR